MAGIIAVIACAVVIVIGAQGGFGASSPPSAERPSASASTAPQESTAPTALSDAALAALPEARYDAVIPALPAAPAEIDLAAAQVGALAENTPISAEEGGSPVAWLAGENFLYEPTTVFVLRTTADGWSEILTPARKTLPSQAADSPAQTSGWVRQEAVQAAAAVTSRVVIAEGAQTLTVTAPDGSVAEFPVGIGAEDTPTPTGVTGYLQARYLDPAQGQTEYPIQLSTLHSTAADEPYGGSDGGLIGIHYDPTNSGAISHGCVRLSAEAIAAVNALPLGTPVTITE
ncbi:lipoprotein-anchoring transpeptidase ErfK/SrfK [Microbacterium resistens]|uniref:Lipoprotein-anchoring transpeptidase ErfK/SrfK n=1 Tax=Microbacterium resistens TaxID=156977 RepID=A0ABU1SAG0_9MICO|nr:L,D-transpeptidase [Microbacterium resistens]MDR6866597.1 lipoprotein-anchoring transpeptidase ErfK/SrfK [Microbacterium resistens]